MSDNEADDDEVDDVTTEDHTGSSDVTTSGGHDSHAAGSLPLEEGGELAKVSGELKASGETRASADRSSGSADPVSGFADPGDDEEDESEYQTDFTISESLEEHDRAALALERSSGLARSTGETFEYVDSDVASGSITPVNEDLQMTIQFSKDDDLGSPVAQSTLIGDDRSIDEPRDGVNVLLPDSDLDRFIDEPRDRENVLLPDSDLDRSVDEPKDRENVLLPDSNLYRSVDEPRDRENVLFPDSDLMVSTAQQESLGDSTDLPAAVELEGQEVQRDERDVSADDSEGVEDNHRSEHDNVADKPQQHCSESNDSFEATRQECKIDYFTDNSEGAKDTFLPEEDLRLTAEDWQGSSPADVDAGLEVKRLKIDDDTDRDDPLEQTVRVEESIASSNDQTDVTRGVVENQPDIVESGSPENADDDDSVERQRERWSGKEFEETGMRDEECRLQRDHDSSSSDPESSQDQTGGGSLVAHSVTVKESTECAVTLSNDQNPEMRGDPDRHEDTGCENVLKEERRPDDDQRFQPDVHDLACTSDADHSVTTLQDLRDDARCGAGELTADKKQNPHQQTLERQESEADRSVVGSKDVRFAEDQSNDRHDSGSPLTPALTVVVTTPSCMQLEMLSRTSMEGADNQLQVVQCGAPSSTWSDDEEKSNLLCLLDSRRRTELDQNNWQLARRLEDKMSLVKDAELDDLENVQVSVKVSPLC